MRRHLSPGQAMIEFLLTLPLLLLLLFLIVTFGKGWRLKQRAVVASRYAAWHAAEVGGLGLMEYFQRDFFYGDPTGTHGAVPSPNDGKADFGNLLRLPDRTARQYWTFVESRARGESVQRASVTYHPPGSLYRYTLQRIGETTSREYQSWHWRDFNFWRFFGERITEVPRRRRDEIMSAFDQAALAGLAEISDPVLHRAIRADLQVHRRQLQHWYDRWLSTWTRG